MIEAANLTSLKNAVGKKMSAELVCAAMKVAKIAMKTR